MTDQADKSLRRAQDAPTPPIRLTIVVARARNGVIGHANTLPWHLPEDLAHFKALTTGHALIMGRKTFDSIGRPLPGRRTIVVTRNPKWTYPGCERADSLQQAIKIATRASPVAGISTNEAMIVGGAQIYREALPMADRIVMTEIDADFDGDASFAALDRKVWTQTSRQTHASRSGLRYAIIEYSRN